MSYPLIDLMQRLGRPRVLIVGDLILDRYIWGDAERVSQEAPVILLREESQEVRLGGAANVANMIRGLEADASLAGVVGDDADGRDVVKLLEESGVDCQSLIVDVSRPTTVKERFLGRAQSRHPHQMLRVDREVRTPLSAEIAARMIASIVPRIGDFQAILVSDYGKGVCTEVVASAIIQAANAAGIPVIVDPSSSGDCRAFVGATAVTPNRLETRRATGREIRTIADAESAGRQLCAQFQLDHAFVTLDSDGICVVQKDGTTTHCQTRKREVYDITGAGDMVLAMIGVGAAAGGTPVELARLANVAGGLEVEQVGVVPIGRRAVLEDLLHGQRPGRQKICTLEEAARQVEARRIAGQRIVLTNGCFDVLHVGHVSYLQQAADEGNCLVVAINSDDSVRGLGKGDDRPIFAQADRAAMLAALEAVDFVVTFDEPTPHAVLEKLRPDLLVKGGTYQPHEVVGRELVEAYGGQVKVLGEIPGMSTTRILARLRGADPSQGNRPGGREARAA